MAARDVTGTNYGALGNPVTLTGVKVLNVFPMAVVFVRNQAITTQRIDLAIPNIAQWKQFSGLGLFSPAGPNQAPFKPPFQNPPLRPFHVMVFQPPANGKMTVVNLEGVPAPSFIQAGGEVDLMSDDRRSIQWAIDDAGADALAGAANAAAYIPDGLYRLGLPYADYDPPLQVPDNVRVYGQSIAGTVLQLADDLHTYGSRGWSTIFVNANSPWLSPPPPAHTNSGITIDTMTLDGNAAGQSYLYVAGGDEAMWGGRSASVGFQFQPQIVVGLDDGSWLVRLTLVVRGIESTVSRAVSVSELVGSTKGLRIGLVNYPFTSLGDIDAINLYCIRGIPYQAGTNPDPITLAAVNFFPGLDGAVWSGYAQGALRRISIPRGEAGFSARYNVQVGGDAFGQWLQLDISDDLKKQNYEQLDLATTADFAAYLKDQGMPVPPIVPPAPGLGPIGRAESVSAANHAMLLDGVTGCTLRDLEIANFATNAVLLGSNDKVTSTRCERLFIHDIGINGIAMDRFGTGDITLVGCTFYRVRLAAHLEGETAGNGQDWPRITFDSCHFLQNGYGIIFEPVSTDTLTDLKVTGCTFVANSTHIKIWRAAKATNTKIIGCHFAASFSTGVRIAVPGDGTVESCTFEANPWSLFTYPYFQPFSNEGYKAAGFGSSAWDEHSHLMFGDFPMNWSVTGNRFTNHVDLPDTFPDLPVDLFNMKAGGKGNYFSHEKTGAIYVHPANGISVTKNTFVHVPKPMGAAATFALVPSDQAPGVSGNTSPGGQNLDFEFFPLQGKPKLF